MRKIFTLLFALLLWAGSSWGQSIIIGNGTTVTDGTTIDPVDRFYNYTHCQIIYTAAELSAAGLPSGSAISAIGFSISESAVSLAGFTIKMGLTAQTIGQPYIATLTTVKPAFTYTPVVQVAGSFDMIPLTTNFTWDGTSNIVVNTCTGSNPYTSPYGGLRYTVATSGTITYVRTDGTDNCPTTTLTSTTYRPNIKFNYIGGAACSGTPAPGNTVSTPNPVCSGVSFTLSLQNSTPGSGVTYQWQSSPNGTVWTNVGTSSSSFTTSQTTATYYRCQVTCSGNTGTSNPLQVTMNPFTSCFCTSTATYTGDEDILNVTVGAINNSSTCSSIAPGPGSVQNMYSNYYFSVPPASLRKSVSQSFSVQIGTCGSNYSNAVKIFIDYNQNGNFADAGEEVYVSAVSTSGPHFETGSFIPPATATVGSTMMRVVNVETSTPGSITPCGTYGWGETEDYMVNIADAPAVTTDPATLISSSGATLNATVSANFSSTTVTFEYGTMATPPFDNTVTVPTPVTGQSSSVSTIIAGLQPNTTYNFRALGTNAIGTTNGLIRSFTTVAVAPAVTTKDPTLVGSSFATMNGSANAFNANTTVTFEYGTLPTYGSTVAAVPATVSGNIVTDFSATLSSLIINTTYYYRAKGVNSAGTTYGVQKTFYTTCVVPPVLGVISGPANVCKNNSGYVFSVAPVPYAFVYTWTFPAGFTITSFPNSNSVTVSVSNAAVSGTITAKAQSDCGAIGPTTSMAVTVNNLPVPAVTGTPSVCQYASNNYTTQAGQTSYVWTAAPDGVVTPTGNPYIVSISWATPGAKTVGVSYTNPATGCTAAAPGTFPVTVNAAPSPSITGVNSMCVNSGYYNYTTLGGQSNYLWTVSSGGVINGGQGTAQIEVIWNTPGAQFVTVNYANGNGCFASAPATFNVTVAGLPVAAGTITGSSNVCMGSNGVAYSVPTITNASTYVWSVPAGASIVSGQLTNAITVNFAPTATPGNITVYGNSICGNGTISPAFPVTIVSLPGAASAITGAASVCEGTTGVAYSVPPVTGATEYTWTLPTGATIASGIHTADITVDFAMGAASGAISVFGTNFCGNGAASAGFNVTIVKQPSAPVITLTGNTLSSSYSDGNQWYYNGAQITNSTAQTHLAQFSGLYWDVVTVNGCSSDTSNNVYVTVTGIADPQASTIVISPIPNNGFFKATLNYPGEETFTILVYNQLGEKVYESNNNQVKGLFEKNIDLRPAPNGIYSVVFQSVDKKIVKKIIVNK